jgi:flagellar biosynthesis protein FlhG
MPYLQKKSKVLTVSGGKGGTGKTFAAVNLAVEMSKRLLEKSKAGSSRIGNRVLLFDADYHLSNAHLFLGVRLAPCLDRFLKDPRSLPEYIISTEYGVDLISFGGDENFVNQIEISANSEMLEELKKLETSYDWIIIDTGAGLTQIILRQIIMADYALLVANPEPTAMIDCYKMVKFISREDRQFKHVGIVINKAQSFEEGFVNYKKLEETLKQFRVRAKIRFAGVVFRDDGLFNYGLQKGIPVVNVAGNTHMRESFNYIWDTILKASLSKKMESFFEKIFLG